MFADDWFRTARLWPCIVLLTLAACASTAPGGDVTAPRLTEPSFPPHEVMQSQLYSAFLIENQEALLQCSNESQCVASILNLGFIYSYPQSPYFNQNKGLYYFRTLMEKYPQHPYASLARIWVDLMNRCILAESTKVQLKGQLKSRESTIKVLQKKVEEKTEQAEEKHEEERAENSDSKPENSEKVKEQGAETDRVEQEIRKKLDQSRAIDVEIERKERELTR